MNKSFKLKVLRRLERGLHRIENIGWTRGAMFRGSGGKRITTSRHAKRFCALGAIADEEDVAKRSPCYVIAKGYLSREVPFGFGRSVVSFNDIQQNKGPVVEVFKKAIAQVKKEIESNGKV